MTYSLSEKLSVDNSLTASFRWPEKLFYQLLAKVRCALRRLPGHDRDFEIMLNTLEIKAHVNKRSWSRNSALIVYSRYQIRK